MSLACLVGAMLVVAPAGASAGTYQEPANIADHITDISEALQVYGEDGSGAACSATCQSLVNGLQGLQNDGTDSGTGGVVAEAGELEEKVGLAPRFAALGDVVLGLGAFSVGWTIGDQLAGWLGLHTPGLADGYGAEVARDCVSHGTCYWEAVGKGENSKNTWMSGYYQYYWAAPKDGFILVTGFYGSNVPVQSCDPALLGTPPGNSYELPADHDVDTWDPANGPDPGDECSGYGHPGEMPSAIFLPVQAAELTNGWQGGPLDVASYPYKGPVSSVGTAPDPSTVETGVGNTLSQDPATYQHFENWANNIITGPDQTSSSTITSTTTTPGDLLEIPAPQPNEVGTHYVTRLDDLGFTDVQLDTVSDTNEDPAHGPNEVVSVNPHAGTSVDPGTEIDVEQNPKDAPEPGTPTDPTGGGGTIDMSPITRSGGIACDSFPFGIPCWVYNAINSWTASSSAPVWDVDVWCPPCSGGHANLHVDLGVLEPAMDVVRPVLVIAATILIAWAFYGIAVGGRPATANGGADDD